MISRYEAYMDGVALSAVNPNLLITDIQPEVSDIDYEYEQLARRAGGFITKETQEGSSVTITFQLRLYSISERQAAIQEVQRWAKGQILETNDRPGQRLWAKCTSLPRITSAMQWTEEISMTFTAFEHPFWEELTPSVLSLTGTSQTGNLFVPGNAGETLVEVIATPGSGTLNALSITVGNTTMSFTSLGATASNPLTVTYDGRLIQSIKVGTTSAMSKRTGADDLLAVCGTNNAVSITAGTSSTITLSARGLWL